MTKKTKKTKSPIDLRNPESINKYAKQFADVSEKIRVPIIERGGPCTHLGAVLADVALQAGIGYEDTVEYRVKNIKHKEADTLLSLKNIIAERGVITEQKIVDFLCLKSKNKISKKFKKLVEVLDLNKINTTIDLKNKLNNDEFRIRLSKIRDVGNKTVDYLGCKVGLPWVAIDSNIEDFSTKKVKLPDLFVPDLRKIVEKAADLRKINRRDYDLSIWNYMSKEKRKKKK